MLHTVLLLLKNTRDSGKSQTWALSSVKIDALTTFSIWHFHAHHCGKNSTEVGERREGVQYETACWMKQVGGGGVGVVHVVGASGVVLAGGQGHDDDESEVRFPPNETANVWPLLCPNHGAHHTSTQASPTNTHTQFSSHSEVPRAEMISQMRGARPVSS